MPTLTDLPNEILAKIYYKSVELMRKDIFDTWRLDFEFDPSDEPAHVTEEQIDLQAVMFGLWGFFRYALKMYASTDEVWDLGRLFATGWDDYEWYEPTPLTIDTPYSESSLDEAEYCAECGMAYLYDGFLNPTLCDHCSYNTGVY